MKKQKLTIEQKRSDTDIGIISFVTLGVFLIYAILESDLSRAFYPSFMISYVIRFTGHQ